MGLHHITEDSTELHFHCTNPDCEYHNCSNWEPYQRCEVHDAFVHVVVPAEEMRQRLMGTVGPEVLQNVTDTVLVQKNTDGRKDGRTRVIPIDHPDIEWTGPGVVALPTCSCGTRMFLKVDFTEKELAAHNISVPVRDPNNASIVTRIDQHPMVARHKQLAEALRARGNVWVDPHQTPVERGVIVHGSSEG